VKGCVYIIKSERNGRFYIGSSTDAKRRLEEFHNMGRVKATRYMRPWTLIFVKEYSDIVEARRIEYCLKQKKSRLIIEKIVNNGCLDIS